MTEPAKMALTSMDVAEEKREELKRCLAGAFPEVFADGSIDLDQLRRVLGEWIDPSNIEATLRDGVLRLTLSKKPEAKCQRITINQGERTDAKRIESDGA